MKKTNKKGFTLIEMLGAVTILAILTVLVLRAYLAYLDWSRKKSFDTMGKSASTAAEQYIMSYPTASVSECYIECTEACFQRGDICQGQKDESGEFIRDVNGKIKEIPESKTARIRTAYDSGISFEELVTTGYLNGIQDPAGGKANCSGKVVIGYVESDSNNKRALDKYIFTVHECCSNYKARYTYTYEKKKYIEKNEAGEKVEIERLHPVDQVTKKDVICE